MQEGRPGLTVAAQPQNHAIEDVAAFRAWEAVTSFSLCW